MSATICAGGVEQAAGGAHGDEDGGGVAGGGFVEAALEVLGGDGLDGVVDGELEDEGLLGLGLQGEQGEEREQERRGDGGTWRLRRMTVPRLTHTAE